ncbi:MAG: ATP-binding protein [SAR324 cluster bacterium]|nr:ATP-binding protein [SAR324 cluster bacterium]
MTSEQGLPKVRIDRPKIEQLLNNVIQNAIEYSPEHGSARVDLKRDGEKIRISISDTGPGISPEAMDKLFHPFGKGATIKPDGGGKHGPGTGHFKKNH